MLLLSQTREGGVNYHLSCRQGNDCQCRCRIRVEKGKFLPLFLVLRLLLQLSVASVLGLKLTNDLRLPLGRVVVVGLRDPHAVEGSDGVHDTQNFSIRRHS